MSTITSIDPYNALAGQRQPAGRTKSELGQEEYLKLMITQFQNQDPFKPMENGEFLGQIAQFGTVSGIAELKDSFSTVAASIFSDQTLQASGLIGRTVLAEVNSGRLDADSDINGAVDVPIPSTSVSVEVRDSAGQLIRRLDLGPQDAGLAEFSWDGVADDGSIAPEGEYTFQAQIQTSTGPEAVGVLVAAQVKSVSLSPVNGALSLNFDSMGSLSLNQIRQIM